MKRIFTAVLAVVFIAALFCGCEKTDTDEEQGKEQNNQVDYEVVKEDELENGTAVAIEKLKKNKGHYVFEEGDKVIVFIGAGEKRTGGYSISVVSVTDMGLETVIVAEEKAPSKDEAVTQALTWPFTVIRMGRTEDRLVAKNSQDEQYPLLTMENQQENTEDKENESQDKKNVFSGITGTYTGQIDANSIEVKLDKGQDVKGSGEFRAFRLNEKVKHDLNENDRVRLSFYENEHDQYVLTAIEKD